MERYTDHDLMRAAQREWLEIQREGASYAIDLDHTLLMCLIGVAQLGLRHPDYTGPSREHAIVALTRLIKLLPSGSASRTLAMRGFDERFDL